MPPPSYAEDVNDRDPEIMLAKAEIARTRELVPTSVAAFQRELSRAFDWREWVRSSPVKAVVLAFGVGAVLGLVRASIARRHD